MHAPLDGATVVENASYISGPYAGLLLAQLGADVVKVEAPVTGDPFRRWGGSSGGRRTRPQFAALNVGKRSVSLDLREPVDAEGYLDLVATADAVIENFRPGVLDRLGVGEAAVRRRNDRCVYVSVTGFGPDGPYAVRPAYDAVVQALSGLWSLLSPVDRPRAVGPALCDTLAGTQAALAVAAGLAGTARRGTCVPLRYDVSMLGASLSVLGLNLAAQAAGAGTETPYARGRRSHSMAFVAADGRPVAVHLSSPEKFWLRLLAVVDREDLATDERFATYAARLEHYETLLAELADAFATRTRAEWLARLHAAGVPAAPLLTVAEVADDEHVRDRGMLVRARGPQGEEFVVPRAAIRFDGDEQVLTPLVPALGGAPC